MARRNLDRVHAGGDLVSIAAAASLLAPRTYRSGISRRCVDTAPPWVVPLCPRTITPGQRRGVGAVGTYPVGYTVTCLALRGTG